MFGISAGREVGRLEVRPAGLDHLARADQAWLGGGTIGRPTTSGRAKPKKLLAGTSRLTAPRGSSTARPARPDQVEAVRRAVVDHYPVASAPSDGPIGLDARTGCSRSIGSAGLRRPMRGSRTSTRPTRPAPGRTAWAGGTPRPSLRTTSGTTLGLSRDFETFSRPASWRPVMAGNQCTTLINELRRRSPPAPHPGNHASAAFPVRFGERLYEADKLFPLHLAPPRRGPETR